MDFSFAGGCFHHDLDACTDRQAVRTYALERKFQPSIFMARIREKLIRLVISRIDATHHRIDILRTVIVDVAKANRVALLQLAETA